jgi:DNA-binding beta-propeller fold protein YncE
MTVDSATVCAERGMHVVWSVAPGAVGRVENLAISPCGSLVAVVDAASERVLLYDRGPGAASPSAEPVWILEGPQSRLDYPHDVDFSPDGRWLVVANRSGRSVTGYRRLRGAPTRFSDRPQWRLKGRTSRLGYCDAVRFVPPDGRHLAAVDLSASRVVFFRRRTLRSTYARRPCFALGGRERGIVLPDGLAFTPDGGLLAVANHGDGTVAIYARGAGGALYGPDPVARISAGGRFRCPHSAAFSPDGRQLVVTNAGGSSLFVHRRIGDDPATARWSEEPVAEIRGVPDVEGPRLEAQEGGPKGVAFGPGVLGFCSPEVGVRLLRIG